MRPSVSLSPFVLGVAAACLPAQAAVAATLWVTQLGSSGPGSLRAAVEAANARPGPDRIGFARGLAGSVAVAGEPLTIRDALEIRGPGGGRIRLRGDYAHRIVQIDAAAGEVALSGLDLTDAGDSAIVNDGAALAVEHCTLRGNAGVRGAAIASYGGDLHVANATIRDNDAQALGGADEGMGGGIYARGAAVTIESTRLSSNHADALGGGLYVELPADGALLVRGSVIDANAAVTQGGGLFVHAQGGPPSGILNSTISGNRSVRNAALWFDGALAIGNSTVTGNYAPVMEIPGVCAGLCGAGGRSELWLTSTLVSANRDAYGNGYDLAPVPGGAHVAHSLIERVADGAVDDDRGANLLGVDPRIGPLRDNGGALPTHAPAPDSPVIDAGADPALLEHDQRGACHARVLGAAADIGAHETQPAPAPRHLPCPRPSVRRRADA
jgi:hypothetical protein